jgi:hypothetical protein
MILTNFWISIPKVNHNDNKAWTTHPFLLVDMKVTSQMSEPDGIGYQQVYQCLKIIVPNFSES